MALQSWEKASLGVPPLRSHALERLEASTHTPDRVRLGGELPDVWELVPGRGALTSFVSMFQNNNYLYCKLFSSTPCDGTLFADGFGQFWCLYVVYLIFCLSFIRFPTHLLVQSLFCSLTLSSFTFIACQALDVGFPPYPALS